MLLKDAQKRRAFSLVELSIVLVILGLLVGGILSGQSLIRASELRTIVEQHQGFVSAVNAFREKYNGLPGDLPSASQIWGLSTPVCPQLTIPETLETCDGDGSGFVPTIDSPSDFLSGFSSLPTGYEETIGFWQHLRNAGLIENSAWASKIDRDRTWVLNDLESPVSARRNIFNGEYRNLLVAPTALKPAELWNIDQKADDGKPGIGRITVFSGAFTLGSNTLAECTDSSVNPEGSNVAANYLLTAENSVCYLLFRNNF
jgi:prepilin-type N-terminal cleavage/methylation domain-containing protein